jgi:hypothetical protein
MHKNQRVNAIQKARRAEAATYDLECYLDDIGFGKTDVEKARLVLRSISRRLAQEQGTGEDAG